MNTFSITILILNIVTDFGTAMFAILSAVIVIGVAYLVFTKGKRLFYDQSLEIGGYYVRNLPYKGYHRFRSKKWNLEHM